MAKIFGSSSSNTSSSSNNSGSFSSGFSSSSKFASLSSFTGKFTATTTPLNPLNRQGILPDGLQQQQGMTTDAFDVGNRSTTAYTTSPFQRLQRLVLQDRVMLSPAEAAQTVQNPSLVSQAEQGATPVSFFGKIGKAMFGIALLPLLPIIGLYKLGDYAVASLKKGKKPSEGSSASVMPAPMPPPMGMGQLQPQPPAPNVGQAPPPATASQASELPLAYGKVVNVPSESTIDPLTPIQFV